METSIPALQAAMKSGIKSVTATMWGDNGNKCNHFQCIPLLPVFSEFCYKGEGCCVSDIISMSEFVTGSSWDVVSTMSCFSEYIESTHARNYIGKIILYSDILLNLLTTETPLSEIKNGFVSALNIFKNDKTFKFSPFATLLLEIDIKKIEIMSEIRQKYKDKKYTKDLIENVLPELKKDIKRLSEMHMKLWHETYKPFGFEVLNGRYGWIMSNINLAIYRLKEFIEGKCDIVEELEIEPIYGRRDWTNTFIGTVTACYLG